jgi:hypothetical protein
MNLDCEHLAWKCYPSEVTKGRHVDVCSDCEARRYSDLSVVLKDWHQPSPPEPSRRRLRSPGVRRYLEPLDD